jgi:chain length determinant protein EpsF
VTPRQIVGILRARWRLAAKIFGGVFLAAVVITLIWPTRYLASASVVVDIKPDPTTGTVNPDQLLTSYLATQVDIASSDRVARRVVQELKLDQDPERRQDWLSNTGGQGDFIAFIVDSVRKKISITPSHESSVITISAIWGDRKTAALLANAFAKAYVDTTIDLKVEPARQYATWFAERSRVLETDIEAKQKRLSDYQATSGITAIDERLDIENARLADLSAAATKAQGDFAQKESKQRQAESNPYSVTDVLQNTLIAELKSELGIAESKLKDLGANVGINYPQYQAGAAQVASLRAQLAEETTKILDSLKSDAQLALRQENEARAAVEAQKKRVLELKHERDQVQLLQNDVAAAQRAMDDVAQRRSQTSLEGQMQQTNALQLTEAVEPPRRARPIIRLNLAIGFLLGLVLAVGTVVQLELVNPIIRGAEDMTRVLPVPLLGSVRSASEIIGTTFRRPGAAGAASGG